MSLILPQQNSPLREKFEVTDLVEWRKLPTFRQALRAADATFKADGAIRSVNLLTLRADCEVWLIEVDRKGGWELLWNFGRPSR